MRVPLGFWEKGLGGLKFNPPPQWHIIHSFIGRNMQKVIKDNGLITQFKAKWHLFKSYFCSGLRELPWSFNKKLGIIT